MRAWLLLLRVAARLLRAEPHGLDALTQPTEPNAFGLDTSTWFGEEAEEVEHERSQVVLPLLNRTLTLASKAKNVFVLGQFNTGTNLLEKLFWQNFHYPTKHKVKTGGIWKHLRPTELAHMGIPKDAVLLVCLRDPLSWLQSMRKAPYDLKSCVQGATYGLYNHKKDGFWIEQPCALPSKRFGMYTMPRVNLHGIADYWNRWTEEYDALPKQGFKQVVFIRYEDMVLETEAVLDEIGQAISQEPPSHTVHVHGPATAHGRSNGRSEAIMKLNGKGYLRAYSPAELHTACQALDRTAMQKHGYTDCDAH
jgi:hypothetical protein